MHIFNMDDPNCYHIHDTFSQGKLYFLMDVVSMGFRNARDLVRPLILLGLTSPLVCAWLLSTFC